jgi:hypothetical protein
MVVVVEVSIGSSSWYDHLNSACTSAGASFHGISLFLASSHSLPCSSIGYTCQPDKICVLDYSNFPHTFAIPPVTVALLTVPLFISPRPQSLFLNSHSHRPAIPQVLAVCPYPSQRKHHSCQFSIVFQFRLLLVHRSAQDQDKSIASGSCRIWGWGTDVDILL